ncbi:MAG: hypothetical protein A2Y69_06785 [Candidatus Aminicenantes bacterium RBG_13_59_9]|nr:MAG: hypothetical protein A2Y69_06785 [Candidatus Aminicenantes bacterium RBG_13_59_9]
MTYPCPKCQTDNPEDSKFCKECATPLPGVGEALHTKTLEGTAEELKRGTVFAGRYEIIEELGRGGMGRVYRAEDRKVREEVALKLIKPEIAADRKIIERFTNELRTARKIGHRNVGRMYDIGEDRGSHYITMEYVSGQDLKGLIRQSKRLSVQTALSIAQEVCEGLAEAHRLGIVHRDLKPSNIMVDREGTARIMDFGIARTVKGTGLTGSGVMIGTPEYMSPEQVEAKDVDQRSDIYSLGIVLYEMVTGRVPFEGDTPFAIGMKHKSEKPAAPKQMNAQIPESLERLILKCLEKDKNLRYQNCEDLLNHLRSTAKDLETASGGIIKPPISAGLRRKRVVVIAGAVFVLLAAVVAWLVLNASRSSWSKDKALAEIEDLAGKDKYWEAFLLASEAEGHIPNDPALGKLWEKLSGRLSVISTPPGADVSIRGYSAEREAWRHIGKTPLDEARIPRGVLHWKLESSGYESYETVGAFLYYSSKGIPRFVLEEKDAAIPGMVRIPEKELFVDFEGYPTSESHPSPSYHMDRYEVTNENFKIFVDFGGYLNPDYWKHEFVKNGRVLSWEKAMAEFCDQSGRPGPATWKGGTYPQGQEKYPVTGVCWYEAAAYAEFVGKSLPTIYHWFGAIDANLAAYINLLSNFESSGPMPVGHYPGVGPYGLWDMAGNVREWCWNKTNDLRFILGGAWKDPGYMYTQANAQSPFDRSSVNGFRCAKYSGEAKETSERLKRPYALPEKGEEAKIEQVSDDIFQIYKNQYHYDRSPLNAQVEAIDESPEYWKVETVSYNSANDNERILTYLFIPKNVKPPYQAVVYFPGGSARDQKTSDKIQIHIVDFIIMSGRAVAYPVYKGTYEKSVGFEMPSAGTQRYVDYEIQLVNEVRRTLDYLETRDDINMNKAAFWGFSWGAWLGPIILATEARIRLGLFLSGGLYIRKIQPVINEALFAPRVKVPVLMINGKYDYDFQLGTGQKALFDLLGTKPEDKEHFVLESGHNAFATHREQATRKVLEWLDRYLGRVS